MIKLFAAAQNVGDMAELSDRILETLVSLPAFRNAQSRRAVLVRAGLDASIMSQIDTSGAPAEFIATVVDILSRYGDLERGDNALSAFLATCKELVGTDKRAILDGILVVWE